MTKNDDYIDWGNWFFWTFKNMSKKGYHEVWQHYGPFVFKHYHSVKWNKDD